MPDAEVFEYMRSAFKALETTKDSNDEVRMYAAWARAYGERLLAMYDLVRSELTTLRQAGGYATGLNDAARLVLGEGFSIIADRIRSLAPAEKEWT
jgi:hypothetical protein